MSTFKETVTIHMLFWMSVLCMLLLSMSFLFMPYASEMRMQGDTLPIRLGGAWLWTTLIIGYLLFFLVNHRRRKTLLKNKKRVPRRKPGIMRIFSNRWAIVADGACVISLVGFFVTVLIDSQSYATNVFLCVLVLTLHLHSVLNGENFKYLMKLTTTK